MLIIWGIISYLIADLTIRDRGRMQVSEVEILSTYIAPWALANEEVPIHLHFNPSSDFDFIRIELPADVFIQDYFNIEEFAVSNQEATIFKLGYPGFLGFTVVQTRALETIHLSKEISIKYLKNELVVGQVNLTANFFRPWVELIDFTKSIVIKDDSDLNGLIHAEVKLTGFGDLTVGIEHLIGKKYQFELEPVFQQIVSRVMYGMFRTTYTDEMDYDENAPIDANLVAKESYRFWNNILSSNFEEEESKKLRAQFNDWIEKPDVQEDLKDLMTSQLEDLAISMILSYPHRFPNDRVDFKYGEPAINWTKVSDALKVKIRYWDSVGNEYEGLEFNIDVHDERTRKETIKLRINIRWNIEPYSIKGRCN
jgi:hypothetical protein